MLVLVLVLEVEGIRVVEDARSLVAVGLTSMGVGWRVTVYRRGRRLGSLGGSVDGAGVVEHGIAVSHVDVLEVHAAAVKVDDGLLFGSLNVGSFQIAFTHDDVIIVWLRLCVGIV